MKTCKKCKKSVSNNTKICKYCGTDLSKVKPNNNINKVKTKVDKLKKVNVASKVNENKTEFLWTTDLNSELANEKTEILDLGLTNNEELPKKIKKRTKKVNLKKEQEKKIKEQLKEFFDEEYQKEADSYNLLNTKSIKDKKVLPIGSIKTKKDNVKNKIKKEKHKGILKVKNQNKKKKLPLGKENEDLEKPTRAEQIFLTKQKLRKQKILKIFLIISCLLLIGYGIYKLFSAYSDLGYIIKENEKDYKKVFGMGEVITYKEVSYSITKVETSMGTAYKKPKEGNQYLIVTINLENNSDKKYHYSSEDFTMINSSKEETNRIISPVNAGRALYSGNLVVGATKEASLVFEQPIDDPALYIMYYDPLQIEKYNKELEELEKEIEEQETPQEEKEKTDESIDETTEKEPKIKKPEPIFKVKIKAN